jgi:hypothetical protein
MHTHAYMHTHIHRYSPATRRDLYLSFSEEPFTMQRACSVFALQEISRILKRFNYFTSGVCPTYAVYTPAVGNAHAYIYRCTSLTRNSAPL